MATRMAEKLAVVEQAVAGVRDFAMTDQPMTLAEFESRMWPLMLAMGASCTALFLAKQASRARPETYLHDGRSYRLAEERSHWVGTRFGRVQFDRRVGRQTECPRAARDLPIDRELGLVGGFSVGVVAFIGRLCAQMAFAAAEDSFALVHGWCPARRSVLRMVDALGDHANGFLDQVTPPSSEGEVLVIEVDGKGAPMINDEELQRRTKARKRQHHNDRHHRRARRKRRPRARRTNGQKSKNAKVATVAVLYTLRRTTTGLEGPINKEVIATFDSMEDLFVRLQRRARARGYGEKPTIFLADGQQHIWRFKQRYFPEARECVDWWHVMEKFWLAGTALFREPAQVKDFVEKHAAWLRKGAVRVALADLQMRLDRVAPTGPGNRYRRKVLGNVIAYLTKNETRLSFAKFRREDLPIGTGVCEGAVRHLVAVRMDGPGMRWSRDRAERLLQLRCILVNGHWNTFETHVAQPGLLRLLPEPIPTLTHNAIAKEAA